MFAIMKRDFRSYFNSPIAYVLIGLYMFILGLFFNSGLAYGTSDFMGSFVGNMSFLLMFFIPILTMKSMAEDKKNGTEVLLLTAPARITDVVLGKFLAAYNVFLVMTAFTLIFPLILVIFGHPDIPIILSSYLGILLYGAIFVSAGVFASSLTENQIVAALISFVSLFALTSIDFLAGYFSGFVSKALTWLSINNRFNDFGTGIIDLTSIVFMISFTVVFIFLTVRVLEHKRWSQG
jgi:ABC-2 type transport system permease protein